MRIGGKSLLGLMLVLHGAAQVAALPSSDWPVTGGDPGGMRYSPLADINRTNVAQLQVAWTYRHGDYRSGWPDPFKGTAFESTPIVVEGRLIFTTPYNRVIALAADTGKELWTFDPQIDKGRRFANLMVNRGVAYWKDPAAQGPCASRVFLGTLDARLVALDAKTGTLRWHFQTVHHDLWDYDLAAPPTLVRVRHEGREIDAVAQGTKAGFVFLLDRETGKPLFPVEECPVPHSEILEEASWPTQPFPSKPPALVPQRLTEADLRTDDPQLYQRCLARFRTLRNEGIFTPPSTQWTILYPGTNGGVNWSGGAFDPQNGLWFTPTNNEVHLIRLDPLPPDNFSQTTGIVMHTGWGGLRWLLWRTGTGLRYGQIRGALIEDDRRCHKPPWGMLHAVDLNTGEIRWQMPVGQDAESGAQGLPNFGPPLVTAGGLVFHAGSQELKLRAHDSATGTVLATFDLPAGLHAGPITYKLTPEGKQYLIIAPGGHTRLGSKLGDYVIAYTLPNK